MLSFLAEQVDYAIEKVSRYQVAEVWERSGLEDDIHELINWYHAGVVLRLESVKHWFEKGENERVREMLDGLIHRARATLYELKTIHTAVIGRYLEENDIGASLEKMASAWRRRTGRDVEIDIKVALEGELSAKMATLLLRISTSAVGNAIMHSGVHEFADGKIWITLEGNAEQVCLEVGDNGKGIPPATSEGYGITRMRQLASQLKTEVDVSSSPLDGTTIRVRAALD